MTWIKLKPLCISSSIVAAIIVSLACAGGDYFEYGNSQFAPEAIVTKKYSPFFYSNEFYYGISYDTEHNSRFNSEIVEDWYNYMNKKQDKKSIEDLLIQTNSEQMDSITKHQIPSFLKTNKLLFTKNDAKTADFLEFLKWSKLSETFALTSNYTYWGYEKNNEKTVSASPAICLKLEEMYKKQSNTFLKNRYWFQWLRACFFCNNYNAVIAAFEKEKNANKNTLYYRAMGYYAGAFYNQKKYAEANYYYSLVYDNCDALKTMAHYSFKPLQEKDWQATLALCKNDEEKMTLWQMLGVNYGDNLRAMKEIAALNPSSDKLDLLLARSINDTENECLSYSYKESDEKDTLSNFMELEATIKDIIKKEPKTVYKWQMGLGYLYTIKHRLSEASTQLTAAQKKLPNNALLLAQWRQLKLIYDLTSVGTITEKVENSLLPDLQWLYTIRTDSNYKELRTQYTYDWMLQRMANQYRKQGNAQKAEWFVTSGQFYNNKTNCENMKSFLQRTNKTPFEQFGQKLYAFSYEDIAEFQAIKNIYAEKIDESILLMEQSKENGLSELLSNPFNGGIMDCHDCDHQQPKKTIYTKLSTLKKMKEMYAALPNDTYNNALLLGNVYYSMTFYGSSRLFYECDITGRGYSDAYTTDSTLVDEIISMKNATKYYNMALAAAKTTEQKAKCTYMLAKCERNEWYNHDMENAKDVDFIEWKYFKKLKEYASTAYYKEVIRECGYFSKCVLR